MVISIHPNYPKRFINELISLDHKTFEKSSEEDKNKWVKEYLENRPEYTDISVKNNEGVWADNSDITMDELKKRKIWFNNELISLENTDIGFTNERPVTPIITGLTGRGMLGKFGPNHSADPIVTRYNPTTNDLEFVAALRSDTNPPMWCIPGGMVDPGESVSATLKREFKEEVASKCSKNILDEIFKDGDVLYSGPTYNDPRTTDMAWIETYVVHYHIDNELANKLTLTPQLDENLAVRWISCNTPNLYGGHKEFIELAKQNQKNKYFKKYILKWFPLFTIQIFSAYLLYKFIKN